MGIWDWDFVMWLAPGTSLTSRVDCVSGHMTIRQKCLL